MWLYVQWLCKCNTEFAELCCSNSGLKKMQAIFWNADTFRSSNSNAVAFPFGDWFHYSCAPPYCAELENATRKIKELLEDERKESKDLRLFYKNLEKQISSLQNQGAVSQDGAKGVRYMLTKGHFPGSDGTNIYMLTVALA